MATITVNRQARHNYQILETYEAGLVLTGQETKSVRNGQINLKGAYVVIRSLAKNNKIEAFLIKAHISLYKPAGKLDDYNFERERKLLLKKKELKYLLGKTREPGLTLVPLKIYTSHSFIKLEIGIAKGKKQYDKREDIKIRDINRRFNILKKRRMN
jgi:SsrA-binding protein